MIKVYCPMYDVYISYSFILIIDCTCRNLSSTEANLFNTNTFCSQPKYHTPPAFPEFTDQQPISKIRDLNSEDPVTLSCQISSQNAASFSIIWEHNNVPISNNLSTYSSVYNDRDGSSTLTIRRPSLVESEGRYRCRVDYQYDSNGNFSLVSREAHFETPREFFQSSILIVCCIHNKIFATSYPQKKETSVVLLYLKLGNRHYTYLQSFSRQMVHSNFHRNLSSLHQLLLITACTVIKSRYIVSPWSAIFS